MIACTITSSDFTGIKIINETKGIEGVKLIRIIVIDDKTKRDNNFECFRVYDDQNSIDDVGHRGRRRKEPVIVCGKTQRAIKENLICTSPTGICPKKKTDNFYFRQLVNTDLKEVNFEDL